VRVRTAGKGGSSTIASVAKGDHVLVAGTGTSTITAKHVIDVKK
jgi:phosphoheptose isomerase